MDFRRILTYGKGTLKDVFDRIAKGRGIYNSGNDFIRITLDEMLDREQEDRPAPNTATQVRLVAATIGAIVEQTYVIYSKSDLKDKKKQEIVEIDWDKPVSSDVIKDGVVTAITNALFNNTELTQVFRDAGIGYFDLQKVINSDEAKQFARDLMASVVAYFVTQSGQMEVADEREEVTEVNVPDFRITMEYGKPKRKDPEFSSDFQDEFKMAKWFNILRE